MTDLDSNSTRPRRRWYSPSLRLVMAIIAVVAVFCGWRADRAHRQARAVAAVRAAGGTVVYDSQKWPGPSPLFQSYDDFYKLPPARPGGPAWLRRWLGDEYFQDVVAVWLNHGPTPDHPERGADDDLMAQIAQFDRLEVLQIHEARITDAGMVHLRGLSRLQGLMLHAVAITDAGLGQVAGLTNLEELHVVTRGTPITSLASLAGLTRLKTLNLMNTRLSDDELAHLGRMDRLGSLHLSNSRFTDAGMKALSRLTSLTYLGMDCSPGLTDAGIADLAKLKALEVLYLDDPGMTDGGLALLAGLPRLDRLQICGAKALRGIEARRFVDSSVKSLEFFGCAIDDAGAEQVGKLVRLKSLNLEANAGVTDAGMAYLNNLVALTHLAIRSTKATEAGAMALQKQIPGLQILVDPKPIPWPANSGRANE